MQKNDTTQPRFYSLIRRGAYLSLAWEAFWPLVVPAFILTCIFLAFSWAGGWGLLRDFGLGPALPWLGALWCAIIVGALYPLRNFKLPNEVAIVRRIEEKSRLKNRPLTAQSDTLSMGDGFADVLWREHKARMIKQAKKLSSGMPAPKADRLDPFTLRAMLPLVVFAAFCYSFSPEGGRISDFFAARSAEASAPTRIDAWIKPPAYTRKPPVYLELADATSLPVGVTVPTGSEFFLRFIGEADVSLLRSGAIDNELVTPEDAPAGSGSTQFSFILEEDAVIELQRQGNSVSSWGVSLIPDQPPKIGFFEDPSAALSGSLEMTYTVEDDYGVVSARTIITPKESLDENARPLVEPPQVQLSLPRSRAKTGVSKVNKDLTDHPWAGSTVVLQLEATDDREQIGLSKQHEMVLPGRRFSKPLAQALVEQRRILALDANRRGHVAELLDAVSHAPPEYVDDAGAVLSMRVAYRRLVDARNDDQLRSVVDLLWEIALGVEFGDLSEAERRLREAQEQLSEALENGASDEEIDRLMQQLREAMNEMMQALAEQARQSPQSQNPFDQQNAQNLTQNDLERMMDRIEDLAKSGAQDAARQMLSELQRMMDNLRAGRHEQQRQAEGNQMNQALDQLSELMQRQQELLNETFRMQQRQQQQQSQRGNEQGDQNGDQNGNRPMTPEELAEALERLQQQQQALEGQLNELAQQLEQLGLGQSPELDSAQQEMGQAGENLGQGNPRDAAQNQGQALEALRRGAQNMIQQMAGDRQQGGQQQTEEGGQGRAGQRQASDPLGRPSGTDGLDAGADVEVPDEIDAQTARRILEAIRKRLAIPDNPLIERDYLERLLRSE